jgi:hypothetical protein
MSKQVQRFEDDPRWQNRKGPGGCDLDKWEAINWFPDLADAGSDPPHVIGAGDSVLVGYKKLRFWLHNVEPSVEPGFYFGDITEELPENDVCLGNDQNIGFEPRHVFKVRCVVDATPTPRLLRDDA